MRNNKLNVFGLAIAIGGVTLVGFATDANAQGRGRERRDDRGEARQEIQWQGDTGAVQ